MRGIVGVHHVAVSVPDIEIARQFYVDLLGAREVLDSGWSVGVKEIDAIMGIMDTSAKTFTVRLGNIHIEVFEFLTPTQPPQDPDRPVNRYGYTHLALQVGDVQATYDRMVKAGIRFHSPPAHSGGEKERDGRKLGLLTTYGRDFFGNVFEIIEINHGSHLPSL
jgi:glyoxylase I family protein